MGILWKKQWLDFVKPFYAPSVCFRLFTHNRRLAMQDRVPLKSPKSVFQMSVVKLKLKETHRPKNIGECESKYLFQSAVEQS